MNVLLIDLPLPLPKPHFLCRYDCEACEKLVRGYRTTTLKRLPERFLLQLRRCVGRVTSLTSPPVSIPS